MNPLDDIRKEIREIPDIVVQMIRGDEPDASQDLWEDLRELVEPINTDESAPLILEELTEADIEESPLVEIDTPEREVERSQDESLESLEREQSSTNSWREVIEEAADDKDWEPPIFGEIYDRYLKESEQNADMRDEVIGRQESFDEGQEPYLRDEQTSEELETFEIGRGETVDLLTRIADGISSIESILREGGKESATNNGRANEEPEVMRWNLHDEQPGFHDNSASPSIDPDDLNHPANPSTRDARSAWKIDS